MSSQVKAATCAVKTVSVSPLYAFLALVAAAAVAIVLRLWFWASNRGVPSNHFEDTLLLSEQGVPWSMIRDGPLSGS